MKSCQNSDCQMNGVQVDDAVLFCDKCGSRLAASGEQPKPVTSVEQPNAASSGGQQNAATNPGKKSNIGCGIAFMLLCVAILVLIAIFL